MRVALFGASGFIGSSVLEELLKAGHQVTALIRNPESVVIPFDDRTHER